jgi:hypothetical protein
MKGTGEIGSWIGNRMNNIFTKPSGVAWPQRFCADSFNSTVVVTLYPTPELEATTAYVSFASSGCVDF